MTKLAIHEETSILYNMATPLAPPHNAEEQALVPEPGPHNPYLQYIDDGTAPLPFKLTAAVQLGLEVGTYCAFAAQPLSGVDISAPLALEVDTHCAI